MDYIIYWQFFVALALGVLIGLEREVSQIQSGLSFGGFRTYTFFSLLGAISGLLALQFSTTIIAVTLAILSLLAAVSYYSAFTTANATQKKNFHMAPELSAIIAYFLGLLTTTGNLALAITLGVVVTTLLALKPSFRKAARTIKTEEVYSTLKFAIITLVILPLLPNNNYAITDIPILDNILQATPSFHNLLTQLDVFNPYKIWLMVIFISGISYTGYILMRFIGPDKGIGITSLLGGLVSSTAVTSSLSIASKNKNRLTPALALGVIIASTIMFARVILEVTVINKALLPTITKPLGLMFLTGLLLIIYYYFKPKPHHTQNITFTSPFTIQPALMFGIFYVLILFSSKLLHLLFSNAGIYIGSALSGLADVDAITLTMSQLAQNGTITTTAAATAITIATFTNTLVKAGIAFTFGNPNYAKHILTALALVIIAGVIGIILVMTL